MKVLFPTEYYPPSVKGGAEISAKLLAEGLTNQGVEVHVLTPKYDPSKNDLSKEDGVTVHRFESPRRIFFKGQKVAESAYSKRRALYYLAINRYIRLSSREFSKKISELQSKEKFDLVHAQNVESVFGLNMADIDVPKIAHIRGLQYFCISGSKQFEGDYCEGCSVKKLKSCLETNFLLAKLIQREVAWRKEHIKNFDHYICVSKYIAQKLSEEGLPARRITGLHNPIDKDHISGLNKNEARNRLDWDYEKIILYVGGLTKNKGVEYLPEVAQKVPEADLVIVGGGPLENWISKKADSIDNLHCKGQFPFREVKHCYRAADILFVSSTWQEPYPRVVIEGQSNGACVVAFSVGGIPEAIENGKTGYLVGRGNITEIVNIIRKLFENKNLIERIGKSAQKKVLRRNIKEEFARDVKEIYESLS